MKRLLAILSIVAISVSVTACGKFDCDICHEEKTGKKYENKYGSEICSDCYDNLKEIQKELEDGLKDLGQSLK